MADSVPTLFLIGMLIWNMLEGYEYWVSAVMESRMPEIIIDLLADWCEMQRAELIKMGYALRPNETPESISLAFYNVQRRVISPQPRSVAQSRELNCPYELRKGLDDVLKKALKGLDLRPHQSKSLLQANYNDALLNHWRIHHFHLGTKPQPSKPDFVERTGPVLFAYVTEAEFYAIDVLEHGGWARRRLLEIIYRNWPKLIERYRVKGALGLMTTPSDADIKRLRSAHILSATQIDGMVYCPPGGGCSASGISVEVVLQHDSVCGIFSILEDYVRQNIGKLVERARTELRRMMMAPFHFKLKLVAAERVELVEANSGSTFPFILNP